MEELLNIKRQLTAVEERLRNLNEERENADDDSRFYIDQQIIMQRSERMALEERYYALIDRVGYDSVLSYYRKQYEDANIGDDVIEDMYEITLDARKRTQELNPKFKTVKKQGEEIAEFDSVDIRFKSIEEKIKEIAEKHGMKPEDLMWSFDGSHGDLSDDGVTTIYHVYKTKLVQEPVDDLDIPEKPTERKKDKPEQTPEPTPEPPGPEPVPPQRGGIIPPEPPGPDPVQTEDDKKPVVVEKTGLQIFREQYREMPEMKRKHAIGEIPFLGLLPAGVIVGGAIAGLTFPWSLIPMAGAAVVGIGTRPLLRLISGERKIQKQIEKQLSEMSDEEFLKMASYLDEETIITLKPHHVITRALEKEARRRTNPKYLEVRKLYSEYLARAEELANKSSRTPAEDDELTKLVGEDGLIEKQKALMDGYNKLNKNIKRGAERVTATFKGNFRGLLNLFNRRNSTTKEYQPALEEYADAELKMLTARAEGDRAEEAKAMAEMPRVMEKYTIVRGIGPLTVSRGPFNSGDKGTTIRVVSDKKDNTIRNASMLAIAASAVIIGQREMARLEEAGNKNYQEATRIEQVHNAEAQRINKDLNNLQNQVQQGQGGVVAPTAQEATKMTNAIKTLGRQADEETISRAAQEQYGKQSYHLDHQKMDAFWNGRTYSSDLQGVSGALRDTSGRMQSGLSELAANAARYKDDHTQQLAEYRDAEEGLKLLADLIDQIRGLPGIIGQIQIPQGMTPLTANVQQVVADWTPLIMGALPTAGVIAKDANDNSKQKQTILDQRHGRDI